MTPALPPDERFLVRAQRLAACSLEPAPVGALIVQRPNRAVPGVGDPPPEYRLLGQACNSQRLDRVATHHAELLAVQAANRHEHRRQLDAYGPVTCYTTAEPCVMCLTALSYAHVGRVVFRRRYVDVWPDDAQARFDMAQLGAVLDFPVRLVHLPSYDPRDPPPTEENE